MIARSAIALLLAAVLAAGAAPARAAGPPAAAEAVRLSPELRELLRAEMREIALGVQGIAVSLAVADWQSIGATAARIRASFIMEKQLTPEQAAELERALPAGFKRLDAEFHQRAARLADAAAGRDAELAVFHYARLIETCAQCHAAYAATRFPGFAAPPAPDHAH